MTMLIGQMLGCLLVAAGIGGAVGWLLRHFTFGSRQAQGTGDRSSLPLTSQALEKLQQELNIKVSETQALEEKMVASNALRQSTEQQLAVQQEHVRALREELAATKQQVLEHETARDAWSNTYAQAVQRATDEAARSQDLRTEVDELQDRLTIQEQELSEKNQQLAEQPTRLGEKEAAIDRLRKQRIEVEAALRTRAEGGIAPRQPQQAANQLSLQIGLPHPSTTPPTEGFTK